MAYKPTPYLVTDGGTGSTTVSGSQVNLGFATTTNTGYSGSPQALLTSGVNAMGAALNMGSFAIQSLADPTNPQDGATKNYVDSVAQGLSPKPSALVATTAALASNTYLNGYSNSSTISANLPYITGTASASGTAVTGTSTSWNTALSNATALQIGFGTTNPASVTQWYPISSIGSATTITLVNSAGTIANGSYVITGHSGIGAKLTATANGALSVDGVTVPSGALVLVKNEGNSQNNGLYLCTQTGGVSTPYILTRTIYMDDDNEFQGSYIFIEEGTNNASSGWISLLTSTPIVGSTNLTFTQFTGAGSIVAGNGLTLSGSTISVLGNGSSIDISASGIRISPTWAGQTSITTLGTIGTGTWQGTAVGVLYGGTGATTASGARTNLSAAPNAAKYWVGDTSSSTELGNEIVPSGGTGITLSATAGTVAVDTTVVATTTNTLTMSNKTLTSPAINNPTIVSVYSIKTTNYTIVSSDTDIAFLISTGATATLPTGSTVAGQRFTIKNKLGSSANVTISRAGSDTIENGVTSWTLVPGQSVDILYDNTSTAKEWMIM